MIPQRSLDKIHTDVKIVLKAIDSLLTRIDLKEYPRHAFDLTNGWTPSAIAVRVREILKLPFGPIKNLIQAIEEEGIIIYQYDTPEDRFDGLTAYTDNGVPVIFVNKNMPNDRIRYTVSHELGHMMMHLPCNIEPWRDLEDEANSFASEFLMPERDILKNLMSLTFQKLAFIKPYWGASKAAIIRRAKDLKCTNAATYKYMMIELGRKNERKHETGFVAIDASKILKEVTRLIKENLNYDDHDMAKIVNLHPNDYNILFGSSDFSIKLRPIRKTS